MSKYKKMSMLVIAIALMLVTLVTSTYAFLISNETNDYANIVLETNIGVSKGIFKTTGGSLNINVAGNTMMESQAGNIGAENNLSLNVSYLSELTDPFECTYDIYYKWNSTSDSYAISDATKLEFTYEIPGVKTETNFVASSNTDPQKINSSSLKISNSSLDTPTIQNYLIDVKYYNLDVEQKQNAGKTWKLDFYVDNVVCGESSGLNLVAFLDSKVASENIVEEGEYGHLQKQQVSVTPNATLGINSSSYENIIYTGEDPNNYIVFNDELWRIIGVYNEDSHGIAGTRLVKIIRNESLGELKLDYKQSGVGSSLSNNGSNEWSDSQIMFMLNGEEAMNKGKIYNGSTYTYANTRVNGNYIQSRTNTGTYYNIWNKSLGSYLSYDENGDSYINKQVYMPSKATKLELTEETTTIAKTLSRSSQDKIQEVTWHLGGPSTQDDTTNNTPVGFYNYERSTYAYDGESSITNSTTRSTTWTGKIGLIYQSDHAYATGGGDTYDRTACLGFEMYDWNDYVDCWGNNWIQFENTRLVNTNLNQWTITPYSSSYDQLFAMYFVGYSSGRYTNNTEHVVRPALYLKADTMIEIDDTSDGSLDNPYIIA